MGFVSVTFRMTFLKNCFVAVVVLVLLAFGGVGYWALAPLKLAASPLDVTILPRSSVRSVVAQLRRAGVPVNPRLFLLMTRALGRDGALKSGNYEFERDLSTWSLLQKMTLADPDEAVATVNPGWTFRKMRDELDANPALRHDSAQMTDAQLLAAIGAPAAPFGNGEGLFFPDTYLFEKDASDLDVYRRAYRLMHERLDAAWEARAPGLPLASPYEALTLASLIERETGRAGDRPLVAAVFTNRLRARMPLQTDPSVIYGLGANYQGRLRRSDLQTDTVYNTYLHPGLPPTPIALPGAESLDAALNPAASSALYFVAKGDGGSVFSDTLDAHNKAVDKYIRGQ